MNKDSEDLDLHADAHDIALGTSKSSPLGSTLSWGSTQDLSGTMYSK